MLDIQCAGCLRMVSIANVKKIGKYFYCVDCRKYIIETLKPDLPDENKL